jgi:hypothetical protein
MKKLLTALAFAAMLSAAHAQFGLVRDASNNIVTRTNAPITWSNAFAFTGTNAATTRTNLFATGGVPSGGASANAIYRADGSGGSSFVSDTFFLARQLTNSAVVTNATAAFGSLTISNIPAGLYAVQGTVVRTNVGGGVRYRITASNQVLAPRNVLGWNSSAAGFYSVSTNMLNDSDAAAGLRDWGIVGSLLFTNTGTVSFFIENSGAATNTFQILTNSFIFLRKLD